MAGLGPLERLETSGGRLKYDVDRSEICASGGELNDAALSRSNEGSWPCARDGLDAAVGPNASSILRWRFLSKLAQFESKRRTLLSDSFFQ